jgi:hypothetical protein
MMRFRLATSLLLVASLAASGVALPQTPSPPLAGTWQFSCTTPRGKTRQFSVQVSQDGSALRGMFRGPRRTVKLIGKVEGNHLSLSLSTRRRSLSLSGTISDDALSVRSARGFTCSASKQLGTRR